MPRVILNEARRGSRSAKGIKTRMRMRGVDASPEVLSYKEDGIQITEFDRETDWDRFNSPRRMSDRHRCQMAAGYKEDLGIRLSPLSRFLKSSVGKHWDKIWSDICAKASPHSPKGGKLLRKYARGKVNFEIDLPLYNGLYVDAQGVLRERPRTKHKVTFGEIEKIEISETLFLEARSGGDWFLGRKRRYDLTKIVPSEIPNGVATIVWGSDFADTVFYRQLNRKEVKMVKAVLDAPRSTKATEYPKPLILHANNQYGYDHKLYASGKFRLILQQTFA